MSDTNDDIAAAITSLSGTAEGSPTGSPAPSESRTEIAEAIAAQSRNPDGTFAPRTPAPEAVSGAPGGAPAPGTGGSPDPAPSGQPAVAPAAGDPAAPPVAPPGSGPTVFDPAKPPSGWTPEMKAKWNDVPEDIRKEITRREEASHQGFEKFRKQMEPASDLYEHVGQYGKYFEHIKAEPKQYLSNIIQMEQTLALGNPAQKFETVLNVAEHYGIPLRQIIDGALIQSGQGNLATFLEQGHKTHKTPAQLPPEIVQELQESRQWRQQFVDRQVQEELSAIKADTTNYPLFDEVSEKMAEIIERGQADNFKDAYELAVWRDPAMRQRQEAIRNGQIQQDAIRNRQNAAAAVATPPSAPGTGVSAAPEPETTEDYVRRAMAAASNGGRA